MNGKSIGVAAALLAGGGALYGGYQLVDGRGDRLETGVAEAADVPGLPDARAELAELEGDLDARGRRGVPNGTGALDFDGGADGDDVTAGARARAAEAEREAEREAARLAMLGTGNIDVTRAPGEEAAVEADRPRGLRDAPVEGVADASGGTDGSAGRDTDIERLLADIAASSERAGDAADSARLGGGADASAQSGTAYAANARLTDKPDQGGFAANRRLTDKPDQGGYVASADTQRFDPCEKADGTTYVGPGTALNPFAETDPCLPQATAQGYQVAQLASPVDPELPPQPVDPATGLVAVDVARPRVPPPPPTGTGSDYRG